MDQLRQLVALFVICILLQNNSFAGSINMDSYHIWLDNDQWQYAKGTGKNPQLVFEIESESLSASFNAQHFKQQAVPKKEADAKVLFTSLLTAASKNYGYSDTILRDIKPYSVGGLSGYKVAFDGSISGVAQFVIIYAASVNQDNSLFVLSAFSDHNNSEQLKSELNQVAANIKFSSNKLEEF